MATRPAVAATSVSEFLERTGKGRFRGGASGIRTVGLSRPTVGSSSENHRPYRGGPRVRIPLPPAESPLRTGALRLVEHQDVRLDPALVDPTRPARSARPLTVREPASCRRTARPR